MGFYLNHDQYSLHTQTLNLLCRAAILAKLQEGAICCQISHQKAHRWGTLAESLRNTAEHVFPEFDEKARDQLALDCFQSLIQEPTLSLAVHQRYLKTLNEALSMHSHAVWIFP